MRADLAGEADERRQQALDLLALAGEHLDGDAEVVDQGPELDVADR